MTTMNNKRNYSDLLGRCKSVGSDQTLVNAVLTSVNEPKNPSNSKSPWRVWAKYLGDEPVFVAFGKLSKKQKADGEVLQVFTDDDGNEILGGTIGKGETFFSSVFANNIANMKEGTMVGLALVSNMYENPVTGEKRITYKCNRVIPASQSNALTKPVYDKVIANSSLAEIPTRYNILAEDFAEDTPMDKMVRQFIAPLNSITGLDVEIVLENDEKRFICKKVNEESVGFSMEDTDKSTNHLGVVYKRGDGMKDIMMKFAYKFDFWNQLGIVDMDHWKKIAYQLVCGLQNTYVFGSTSLDRVMAMTPNINDAEPEDEDEDPNPILITTGFISRIECDMASTVRNIGIKLSNEYVAQNYGIESNYKYSTDHINHPLNQGWSMKMDAEDTQIFNFSELHEDQHPKLWKLIRDKENVEFWGVPEQNNSSDLETPDEDPKHLPAVVFVIIN